MCHVCSCTKGGAFYICGIIILGEWRRSKVCRGAACTLQIKIEAYYTNAHAIYKLTYTIRRGNRGRMSFVYRHCMHACLNLHANAAVVYKKGSGDDALFL